VKRHAISLLFLISLALLNSCATAPRVPNGWILHSRSNDWHDEELCANYTKPIRIEIAADDHIQVFPWKENLTAKEIEVPGGQLFGADRGEWGGELILVDKKSGTKKQLSDENVRGFIMSKNRILVLTGIAHLSLDEGKIYQFDAVQKRLKSFAELGGAPRDTLAIEGGAFLVLTANDVELVGNDGKVTSIFRHNLSMATSIRRASDGTVAIGASRFISLWRPSHGAYEESLYIDEGCRQYRIQDNQCLCK
jgi:hypothetical protein